MSNDLLARITTSIVDGQQEQAVRLSREALQAGLAPLQIVQQGLTPGMAIVGDRFAGGDYFIPHLVMAGKAMKAAMQLLEPELKRGGQAVDRPGTAVIGTVHGDIHEIGKSLVGIMLTANGFQVHDLGVNVPPADFVAKVKQTGANLVGLSALLTTTMIIQRKVIQALEAEGLRQQVKVMVGGAPVKAAWAEEIGADGYAEDASGAVPVALRLVGRS